MNSFFNTRFFATFFALCVGFSAFSQNGYQIRVKLNGLNYDTLWFGHTFGKRSIQENFALKQPDGWYELKSEANTPADMYAIIYKRAKNASKQSIQCLLPEGERVFSLETGLEKPMLNPKWVGSPANERYAKYINDLNPLLDLRDSLCEKVRELQDEAYFRSWVSAEEGLERDSSGRVAKFRRGELFAR